MQICRFAKGTQICKGIFRKFDTKQSAIKSPAANSKNTHPEEPVEDEGIAGLNACCMPGCIPFGIAMPFPFAKPLPATMKLPFAWWKPFIGMPPFIAAGWNIEVAIDAPQLPGANDVVAALWHSVPDATATEDVVDEVEGADEEVVDLLK